MGGPLHEERKTVILVDTEASEAILRRRVREWTVPTERLCVFASAGPAAGMVGLALDEAEDWRRLQSAVMATRPALVIVDSLSGAHAMDENSSRMRLLLLKLARLARDSRAALLVVHHLRKRSRSESRRRDARAPARKLHARPGRPLRLDHRPARPERPPPPPLAGEEQPRRAPASHRLHHRRDGTRLLRRARETARGDPTGESRGTADVASEERPAPSDGRPSGGGGTGTVQARPVARGGEGRRRQGTGRTLRSVGLEASDRAGEVARRAVKAIHAESIGYRLFQYGGCIDASIGHICPLVFHVFPPLFHVKPSVGCVRMPAGGRPSRASSRPRFSTYDEISIPESRLQSETARPLRASYLELERLKFGSSLGFGSWNLELPARRPVRGQSCKSKEPCLKSPNGA